jgi:adenylylsulfate kinase
MPDTPKNIHPVIAGVVSRIEKEARLGQHAKVLWLCGLSGSGKSTLAAGLERRLAAAGLTTHLLDGDSVRAGLNGDLGFSDEDRAENIRRVAEVARLFVQAGVVVICSFITPTRALRELARRIVGADDFLEIHVDASLEACARRDPKGLYAKADRGEIRQFTGRDAPFEPPVRADLVINTEHETPDQSLDRLLAFAIPQLRPRPAA